MEASTLRCFTLGPPPGCGTSGGFLKSDVVQLIVVVVDTGRLGVGIGVDMDVYVGIGGSAKVKNKARVLVLCYGAHMLTHFNW